MKAPLVHSGIVRWTFPFSVAIPVLPNMPEANKFRHQVYTDLRPTAPHHWLTPEASSAGETPEFRRRMAVAGETFRAAGVSVIYLVHGTFAGFDALGLLAALGRVYPAGREAISRIAKLIVDSLAGDAGNFTTNYARRLQEALNAGNKSTELEVRTFIWSSENHHLGRADAAVRLIGELHSLGLGAGRRIQLWGHSHGGNVFALLTNLLAGDGESLLRFFDACRIYYQWPLTGFVDIPVWQQVEDLLYSGRPPLAGAPLDIVTLGTPIRYGWDGLGYSRLLHFVNHRPRPGVQPWRGVFPPQWDDVLRAAGGDYVQQVGIAGTNTMPAPTAWRAWTADHQLGQLVQSGVPPTNLMERLSLGARVQDAGATLLVDYGPSSSNLAHHLAGHAVYTRQEWALFHIEEVARRFYESDG